MDPRHPTLESSGLPVMLGNNSSEPPEQNCSAVATELPWLKHFMLSNKIIERDKILFML